jgi:hypothetical protein
MNISDFTNAASHNLVVGANVFEQINGLFNQGKGTIIIGVGVTIILAVGFIFWRSKSWGATLSTMVLGALVGWFVVGGYSKLQESLDETVSMPVPAISHTVDLPHQLS